MKLLIWLVEGLIFFTRGWKLARPVKEIGRRWLKSFSCERQEESPLSGKLVATLLRPSCHASTPWFEQLSTSPCNLLPFTYNKSPKPLLQGRWTIENQNQLDPQKKTTCIVLLTNHIKRSSQVRKIDLTLNCIQYMGNICGKTNFRYATLIFVMSFNRRLLEGSFVDWRMDFMWGDWVGTPRVCLNQQGTTSSNSKSPYNQSKSRLLKELIKITFMLLVWFSLWLEI